MFPTIPFLFHLWVGFLCIGTLKLNSCVGDTTAGCLERERQALIEFKQGLKDPSDQLSSWNGDECCRWSGVQCNNRTGHVVKLDLRSPYRLEASTARIIQLIAMDYEIQVEFERSCISGEINPSLLELKYLNHLDLSINCFGGIGIPKFIGSFNRLIYLNLSSSGFGGRVPHELGNLSTLRYLDLKNHHKLKLYSSDGVSKSFNIPSFDLHVDSLHWLSHLSSLQHLDMGGMNLSMAVDWLLSINMLPSILNLQLSSCSLGSIPMSLSHVNLTSLSTLDLSYNSLGPEIPAWLLFNNSGIVSLHLGSNFFTHPIPTAFGDLCNLQSLNLQGNNFSGEINRFKESFKGCIRSSLKNLNLGGNGLTGYLPDWLGQFTNINVLSLSENSLSGPIPSSLERLSSLIKLHIRSNSLSGSIPPSLGTLSSLRVLVLGSNSLSGSIPPSLGGLSSLNALILSNNFLSGTVPSSLGSLSSLKVLYLDNNQLNGSIPESIGQLSNLVSFYVSNNSFEGVLSEAHFSKLRKLKQLFMSSTSVVMNVSSNWIPPFQLKYTIMNDCKLGPHFPPWLQTQKELIYLSFANASISDSIPEFFWNLSSNIYFIDLSSNSISGSIIRSIGEKTANLMYLKLSSNRLKGSIPKSICKMKFLMNLILSNNHLTDEIPRCLGDVQFLMALDLENNSLSGDIPSSISHLSVLHSLHLSKNKFSGELPASIRNCTGLVMLDLGENNFSGKIPKWIGERLTLLKFLILRSNMFDGDLPPQLSLLSELQVLDLSQNRLSGAIPTSFGNFSAMAVVRKANKIILMGGSNNDSESIWVFWKGSQYKYSSTISLVININLSENDLHGEIPTEIAHLYGLQSLNLSKNHLSGAIPENISDLRWIESLDLSWNQLSGRIPNGLSHLYSLSHLNLSYNNFSGRIPSGPQLDTINDSSIYIGNPFLCGSPLINQCPGNETSHDDEEEAKDKMEIQLFYISMGPGFVVGFWAVCGVLLLKRSWRIAFYKFFDDMGDRLYVAIARKVAALKNNEGMLSNRGLLFGRGNVRPHALPGDQSG